MFREVDTDHFSFTGKTVARLSTLSEFEPHPRPTFCISKEEEYMKSGTKVINKISREERVLESVRVLHNGSVMYQFKCTKGTVELTLEKNLEEVYYFKVHNHPTIDDADRRKTKKKRKIQMTQPFDIVGEESIFEHII